jgi:diadenosine tetraphosphate (Ap4A) HIT family hydrolase
MKYDHLSNAHNSCSICAELTGSANSRLAIELAAERITSAVAYKSEHFAIVPSLGPLVVGHSLLVTRTHERSVLLYANDQERRDELATALKSFTDAISRYNDALSFILFEHGSTRGDYNLCSTVHAHLHIVPLPKQSIRRMKAILDKQTEPVAITSLRSKCEMATDFVFTLYYDDGALHPLSHFRSARRLESQYMRKVIAITLGLDNWDWKHYPNCDVLKETIKRFFGNTLGWSATNAPQQLRENF